MLLINEYWEDAETLRDVSRIIREYYNRELADKLDELIDEQEFQIETLIEELEQYTIDVKL